MCEYVSVDGGVDGSKPGLCDMEHKLLPNQYVPPLLLTDKPKGTAGLIQFGASKVAGVARSMFKPTIELP